MVVGLFSGVTDEDQAAEVRQVGQRDCEIVGVADRPGRARRGRPDCSRPELCDKTAQSAARQGTFVRRKAGWLSGPTCVRLLAVQREVRREGHGVVRKGGLLGEDGPPTEHVPGHREEEEPPEPAVPSH